MSQADLIDTTEMYLKTIYELEENGVIPLRARIVERLGHSGPTVSQTIARMERDGLVELCRDRHLELTPQGRALATDVIRKHRLAELLLLNVIGLPWQSVHEEACRWEHVMSQAVEARLVEMLNHPDRDPYGNPIPGTAHVSIDETSIDKLAHDDNEISGTISRIGEPIQASEEILALLAQKGLLPGATVSVLRDGDGFLVWLANHNDEHDALVIPSILGSHLFLTQ